MNTNNCIFCKIINQEIPAQKIYEDEDFIAFNDIKPHMPVHFLIVPKKHIAMLADCQRDDNSHIMLLGKMMTLAPVIASQQGCKDGFKVMINNGAGAGQEVFHLHLHVMGNK